MSEQEILSKKEPQKMFEPQEKNPEKQLPAGNAHPAMKLVYLLIINAVVFGVIYSVAYLFFSQDSTNAKMAAEIVAILTLIASFIFWVKSKNK